MDTVMSQAMKDAIANNNPVHHAKAAPGNEAYQGRSIPDKPRKQRTPPRNLERLSIRDNHGLCDFLLKYSFVPGESLNDVAASANQALGLNIINENHVRHRMEEFGLKLIPARNVDQSARLELLEAAFREMAQRLLDNSPGVVNEMPATRAFLDSFGG